MVTIPPKSAYFTMCLTSFRIVIEPRDTVFSQPNSVNLKKLILCNQPKIGGFNMSRFTIPRDVYFGQGTVAELKNLKGKRAAIVIGGNSVKKNGALAQVEKYLKEAGMETTLIEGVENDPSVQTVMNGVQIMNQFQPDWIVGLGGGSPMDAAKAMWIFYEYPEFTFEEAAKPFNLPELRQKAKYAAIPTTSGTGSEVTSFAVLTDKVKNKKYPLAQLLEACKNYITDSSAYRKITWEYVMLKDVNDKEEDAFALAKLIKDIPGKVNLIPFNPFPNSGYECSSMNRINRFKEIFVHPLSGVH